MSQPVSHGYPDWHRVIAQSDVRYCEFNEIISAQVTKGPFFVGNSPAVALGCLAGTNSLRVRPTFFNDPAMLQFLGLYDIHLAAAGVDFNQALPVLGPYMGIELIFPGANIDYLLRASGVPYPARFGDASDDILFDSLNVAVAAGATVTLDAPVTRPGAAHWQIHTGLATFSATLRVVDYVGNVRQLASLTQAAQNRPYLVYLPAMTPRITFTNQTGAPGTFNAHLISRPMVGGW